MKKNHTVTSLRPAAGLLLAGSLFLTGCEKKSDPAASPEAAAKAAAEVVQASADVLVSTYGFAARVSKDAELMGGAYRLGALWDKLAASRWAAALLDLQVVRESPEIQSFLTDWRSDPGAQHAREVIRGLFGEEFVVVGGDGTGRALKSVLEAVQTIQRTVLQGYAAAGGADGTGAPGQMPPTAVSIAPVLTKVEIPPVYVVFRASSIREHIDQAVAKAVTELGKNSAPGVSLSTEPVGGKYEFQVLNLDGDGLLAGAGDQIRPALAQLTGSPEEAKTVEDALQAKKIRVACGWVDDYFVLALGPDLSHIVFAEDPSQSVLANPRLAAVASTHASRQPLTLSWVRASLPDSVQRPLAISDFLDPLTAIVRDLLSPPELERIKAEARAFDEKYAAQQKSEFDDAAGVSWWEDGFRAESWGGLRFQEAPVPQRLASLRNSSTLVSISGSGSTSTFRPRQWLEDLAVLGYSWYTDLIKAKMPQDTAVQAGAIEVMLIPAVKDLWRAIGLLSDGLGKESAMIVDGAGVLPQLPLPGLPPSFPGKVRIPRFAIVSEIQDRAKIGESWDLVQSVLDRAAAVIPPDALQGFELKPVSRAAGDATIYHFALPFDTGDILPHTAIANDLWLIGSAPSYAQEVAGATLTTGDPVLLDVQVSPGAFADLAESWYRAALEVPEINRPDDAEFTRIKSDVETGLRLARAFSGISLRVYSGDNTTRGSFAINWKDLD